jgi:hypothetical protein
MSSGLWFLTFLVASPFLLYLFQVGRRKQAMVRFRLRRFAVAMLAYFGGIIFWIQMGHSPGESIFVGFILAIAAGFLFVPYPNRTRRIPKHIRRAVIERDMKGQQFDPTQHHLDHIIPFSKGGDHSLTNLRVVNKTENTRRGARMPNWKELL